MNRQHSYLAASDDLGQSKTSSSISRFRNQPTVSRKNLPPLRSMLLAMLLGAIFVAPAAAAVNVQVIAVGDGTQFNTWALAAHAASLANNNYTIKGLVPGGGPYAAMLDTRPGGIPLEQGELWVVWDANINNIWCYLNTDSLVAMRGFFASPRTQLLLDPAVQHTPGLNLVPGLAPDAPGLPLPVFNAINLAFWNAAMAGVTPAQARAENNKILAVAPNPPKKYGYGPAPFLLSIIPTPPFAGTTRTPVDFNIAGADPITAAPIPPSHITVLRNSLVIPMVNASNNVPPGGIGSFIAVNHNVTEPCGSLSAGLNGTADTTAFLGAPGLGNPLNVFLRELLDATWYEMETKLWAGCKPVLSQETGVFPPASDPLNLPNLPFSVRQRVSGQESAINAVVVTPDSASYVSWTCNAPFAPVVNTYVTVNGQNPFVGPWTGVFPPCGAKANLAYPLQLTQHVVTDVPVPPGVAALVAPVKAIVTPGLDWQ
jgi:hypothetical protein